MVYVWMKSGYEPDNFRERLASARSSAAETAAKWVRTGPHRLTRRIPAPPAVELPAKLRI